MIPERTRTIRPSLSRSPYAMEGFVAAVKTERNIKVMLVAGVCTRHCRLHRGARYCRVGHDYHLLRPGDSRRAVQYRHGGHRRPGDPRVPSAGKACEGHRRRLCIRSFHYRRASWACLSLPTRSTLFRKGFPCPTICSLPMRFWTKSPWMLRRPRIAMRSRSSTRLRA